MRGKSSHVCRASRALSAGSGHGGQDYCGPCCCHSLATSLLTGSLALKVIRPWGGGWGPGFLGLQLCRLRFFGLGILGLVSPETKSNYYIRGKGWWGASSYRGPSTVFSTCLDFPNKLPWKDLRNVPHWRECWVKKGTPSPTQFTFQKCFWPDYSIHTQHASNTHNIHTPHPTQSTHQTHHTYTQ